MKKVIIFTHKNDIDGINALILAKLAFSNLDYELCPGFKELDTIFNNYLNSNLFSKYDQIYITDLALQDPTLKKVANSLLRDKILIFDHHQTSINNNLNRYEFTHIIEKDEHGKKCATQIFYQYLITNNFLKETKALDEFVSLTRLEDTWDWKKDKINGEKAHDLAILFSILQIPTYITTMLDKLRNNPKEFKYTDEELRKVSAKKEEYLHTLKKYYDSIIYLNDEFNNKFGILTADYEYRNEIAEYIRGIGNPENIKYIVIVAMSDYYLQKSYRSITNNFDVSKIAELHGGGGHRDAASVKITKEQKNKAKTLDKEESLKYLAKCKYLI